MTDLTEMVEWLRKQIEDDQAHAEKDLWVAARTTPGNWRALYGVNSPASCVTVEDDTIITLSADRHEADAMHVARFKPETVARRARDTIARCEAELKLVDDLLTEEHFLDDREWYGCRSLTEGPDETSVPTGQPCTCGRDDQVERRIGLLAEGYRHRPGWEGGWAP